MIYGGEKILCNITTKLMNNYLKNSMNETSSMMENLLIPNLNKIMVGA
jgi:hypothetical protein